MPRRDPLGRISICYAMDSRSIFAETLSRGRHPYNCPGKSLPLLIKTCKQPQGGQVKPGGRLVILMIELRLLERFIAFGR